MADIELIIKIPRKVYKAICDKNALGCDIGDIKNMIRNGTPLPKGHGRLVDADEIDNNIYDLTRSMDLNYGQISEVVDTAPTIIEKDDEVEE